MEKILRYELIWAIPELEDSIYPTNAPENVTRPYLVYARLSTRRTKTLEGYTERQALGYMFSVIAKRYGEMRGLVDRVEVFLASIPKSVGRHTMDNFGPVDYEGLSEAAYSDLVIDVTSIQDIDINNITEQYEHELGVYRGIIDFTIYY